MVCNKKKTTNENERTNIIFIIIEIFKKNYILKIKNRNNF